MASLPGHASPATDDGRPESFSLDPPGRVALVGVGKFGEFCLDAYGGSADITVLGVADEGRPGPLANTNLVVQRDWNALLDDPAIEVVHIATPPFLRSQIAIPALRAGKSVFCEKPLAISLDEADTILQTASDSGRVVGINYVLRHHPAFTLLKVLASLPLFGSLRTFSVQNFAQQVPAGHWMWDESRSGGIFVEHGVHFFDAYGQIVGPPLGVWAKQPRKETVQASVRYGDDILGHYFHEFLYPRAVERTDALLAFERGHIEIRGWIPEHLSGRVVVRTSVIQEAIAPLRLPSQIWEDGDVCCFDVLFPDRAHAYSAAIVDGLRDLIRAHRDPSHVQTVSERDARNSLALAVRAHEAIAADTAIDFTK
ncbi:MAG: hypothetical protein NVSMB52_20030 [Chloroflexota bacterium]